MEKKYEKKKEAKDKGKTKEDEAKVKPVKKSSSRKTLFARGDDRSASGSGVEVKRTVMGDWEDVAEDVEEREGEDDSGFFETNSGSSEE